MIILATASLCLSHLRHTKDPVRADGIAAKFLKEVLRQPKVEVKIAVDKETKTWFVEIVVEKTDRYSARESSLSSAVHTLLNNYVAGKKS